MLSYKGDTIEKLAQPVLLDEYDDIAQNEQENIVDLRDDFIRFYERNREGEKILDIGCGCGGLILPMGVTNALEPHAERRKIAKFTNPDVDIQNGWAENIPFPKLEFNTVVSWGTFMFVRSMMEALVEVNRVLQIRGRFIFDVVIHTTMPLAQTVSADCFPKYVELFGFSLIEKRLWGWEHYQRLALAYEKVSEFDWRQLRMPQAIEGLNNFLEGRDWYIGEAGDDSLVGTENEDPRDIFLRI